MQSSEYLKKNNRVVSIYVDGNTAIEIDEPQKKEPGEKEKRLKAIEEQKKAGIRARRHQQALRRNKACVIAAASLGGCIVLTVMILLLCSVITYNTITNEIETLSAQLDTLTLQNDSAQYDIDSSVELSEIIETATEELGMVRSTSSDVVIYSDTESEYVDQVAEIPKD